MPRITAQPTTRPEEPGSRPASRPTRSAAAGARWKGAVQALLLLALVLALPRAGQARFDPGNVGLPPNHPGIDPGNPPPPPPPPPPLGLQAYGLGFIDIVVRAPAGQTSQLLRQAPGSSSYAPFSTPTPGVETTIHDANLSLGKEYCYQLKVSGGTAGPDQTYTVCATTDWRIEFAGPGIGADESAQVLRTFDWRDTQPIAPGTDSEPALYHMNILVEGADPLAEQGFRLMGMHVQAQPIFEQELEGWNDSQAIATECNGFDHIGPTSTASVESAHLPPLKLNCVPVGRWMFAAVPGNIYNEIRTRMLDQINHGQAPGIRALVFRHVPVDAALATGVSRHVLNYNYLGQQGFEFNAIERCSYLPDGTRVCETQQELLGWLARKIITWVVELADDVVEGVRSAIGAIERLIKGEIQLDLTFNLLNTDPAFGADQTMRSGWSGQPLYLAGVTVEVRQGLAAFYETTDAQGFVSLKVAKNADTKVCIQVENDTALLTEYVLRKTICVASLGTLTGNTQQTVDVSHPYLNTLAAMTDARAYLRANTGIDMPQVTVLVGDQADGLAAAGRSFAPCMGRVPSLLGLAGDLVGALGSLLNPAFLVTTTAIEFFYSVDIVLRKEDEDSRGVPVHEYGHTVMCEMLLNQGIDAFEEAWTDVILATSDQSAGSEASYINEGWADFMAAQVVGGTNYFSPTAHVDSKNVHYCPAGNACFDENFHDKSSFSGQVARVVSILQDAFDGTPQGDGLDDASDWVQSPGGPLTWVGANDSDLHDETVHLAGTLIPKLFEHWDDRGQLLSEDNFFGGLADLMKEQGVSDNDVCALFALHDPSTSCPGFVARRSWLPWLNDGAGATRMLDAFASTPPPAPVSGAQPARDTALIAAIAGLTPGTPDPSDPGCAKCTRPVVLDGVQKVRVTGHGADHRDTAFAFRLGDGSFKAMDPLAQLFQGTWSALDAKGAKLVLRPDAKAAAALAGLVADAIQPLGIDGTVRPGRAKISLKLAKGNTVSGKIKIPFDVDVGGQTAHGAYVAKVRGQ